MTGTSFFRLEFGVFAGGAPPVKASLTVESCALAPEEELWCFGEPMEFANVTKVMVVAYLPSRQIRRGEQ